MKGFTIDTSLYLFIGFYHIKLGADADAQKLYNIVFPWGKNKKLPIGIKIAWILIFFKASCLSLSKIWNMLGRI
jgi:hypothetical protein